MQPHSDETLFDYLRGELDAHEAAEVEQWLQTSQTGRDRLAALAEWRSRLGMLPEVDTTDELHAALEEHVAQAIAAEANGGLSSSTSRVLLDATSLDHEALRAGLESRFKQEFQRLKNDQAPPEIGLLVDYHRGELPPLVHRDVTHLLRQDALFAAISRAVQRTLRVLAPLELEAGQELRRRVVDVIERGRAEALPDPAPDLRDLIDLHRQELSVGEEARLRQMLQRSPGLVADQLSLEQVWQAASGLAAIQPTSGLEAKLAAALRNEASSTPLALGRDALRGELPTEYAEAFEQESEAADSFLAAFAGLPTTDDAPLAARMAAVLAAETQPRTSSESDRIRLRRSLPRKATGPIRPKTLPQPRRMSTKRKGRSLARPRGVVIALWLHAVVLSLAWLTVVNLADAPASLKSLSITWAARDLDLEAPDKVAKESASPTLDTLRGEHQEWRPSFVPFALGDFLPDSADDPSTLEARPFESLSDVLAVRPEERELLEEGIFEHVALAARQHRPGSALWFQLREAPQPVKFELLATFEGDINLLARLDEMLSALVRDQLPDGSWGFSREAAFSDVRDADWQLVARQVETTSLALLALLGDGYGLERGPRRFREAMRRGTDWLVARQHGAGGFVEVEREGQRLAVDTVQADAIAALALVEAFRAPGGRSLRTPMIAALKRVLKSQINSGNDAGAWRFGSDGEADMVATCWAIQALTSGRQTGWNDPRLATAMADCVAWLNRRNATRETLVPDREFGQVAIFSRSPLSGQSAERSVAAATSASLLLSRLLQSQGALDTGSAGQLGFLSRPGYLPDYREERSVLSSRYNTNLTAWYFASLSCWQGGIENNTERTYLNALYSTCFGPESRAFGREGTNAGTLAPLGELEERMGRNFATALGALCITNAYRTRIP